MRLANLQLKSEFRVMLGNSRSQFAEMVLKPGNSEGGPKNRHKGADQWLFVVSGRGVAFVNGKTYRLKRWSLILIESGETHEIRNTGRTPLRTVNTYLPPAYRKSGAELPAGKS